MCVLSRASVAARGRMLVHVQACTAELLVAGCRQVSSQGGQQGTARAGLPGLAACRPGAGPPTPRQSPATRPCSGLTRTLAKKPPAGGTGGPALLYCCSTASGAMYVLAIVRPWVGSG